MCGQRTVPQLYGQAEFQAVNYEIFTGLGDSSREWVPFLLLGSGYIKTLSPRPSVYAEVLFDVLQGLVSRRNFPPCKVPHVKGGCII
jgi:hypothetical protein